MNKQPMLSSAGGRITRLTGVRSIMKDIAAALAQERSEPIINLGAGNPISIPEMDVFWKEQIAKLAGNYEYSELLGRYGETKGYGAFVETIADTFNSRYGLSLCSENILITPGSQAIFFYAANLFTGHAPHGPSRHLLLPAVPDYTGYGGVSLHEVPIQAIQPEILQTSATEFRYTQPLPDPNPGTEIGCIFVSRPANPTGRTITETELQKISDQYPGVPFFVDNAYGAPFPNVNWSNSVPVFSENFVNTFSFSKTGFPGERIGIAIGAPAIIERLQAMQANVCIHSSRFGQAVAQSALASGQLERMCDTYIKPRYQQMFELASGLLAHYLSDFSWRIHKPEGGMFIWLHLANLKIRDVDLYAELLSKRVAVVPGSVFFSGVSDTWAHKFQCLRLSLTVRETELEEAIRRIAVTLREGRYT